MELSGKFWGKKSETKNPILLLHGMGGTGALWRPIAAHLEEDFSILALDQRGHGGSQSKEQRPQDFSAIHYAQDVVETLKKRSFYPCWVVGHSMGVRTACGLYHLNPQMVQGMVLIDLGFGEMTSRGLGLGLHTFLQSVPERFESRNAAREYLEENCPDSSIGQYLSAVLVSQKEGVAFPFSKEALLATIETAEDVSIGNWLRQAGQANLPVWILRGSTSRVWPKEEYEKEKAEFSAFRSIRCEEVEGAGHGIPFEKRPWFVDRLRDFILTSG